jgi:hypothetical protein
VERERGLEMEMMVGTRRGAILSNLGCWVWWWEER